MKKYKVTLALFLISLLLVAIIWPVMRKNKQNNGDDYQIGIFANDGVAMVSISKSRNMINFLEIDKEAKLWIPEGMGWYRSEVIKKILTQENKKDLGSDILFYNFGFVADKVVFLDKIDNWKSRFWWRIKVGGLIGKNEVLDTDSDIKSDWLNEIMLRDFSETKVLDEDLKVSVINVSEGNGLAAFMTNNLERLGFSVVSIATGDTEKMDHCMILYGDGVEKTYSLRLLTRLFDCEKSFDLSLNSGEIELYFDDKFTSVIKYSSYKK
jgi:hypothetical protein